jgi:UDP-glucose 4-epimerase
MQLVHTDWGSTESLTQVCRGMDFVVHLAAMDDAAASTDAIGALQMNGVSSLRLLEAAKVAGIQRFIYFSTVQVYGEPLLGTIDETVLPRPIQPYAISHKVMEDFVLAAHHRKEIAGVVVRLSNCFGAPVTPDMDRWNLLVNDLCRQAVVTQQLRLKSNGFQLRDFITLGDVGRALIHLLMLDAVQLGDGLFNLGGGGSMSILEMAKRISVRYSSLTGCQVAIVQPPCSGYIPPLFAFRCEKLSATGFSLLREIDREIDDTLKLCMRAFG